MDNYSFLVLGSNSFTGSHFIAYLLNHGFKVFGVSRSPELANPFWLTNGIKLKKIAISFSNTT